MTTRAKPATGTSLVLVIVALAVLPTLARAQAQPADVQEMRSTIRDMQETIEDLNRKVDALERAAPATGTEPAPNPTATQSPITPRDALNDQQGPAPRPDDITLDPEFRGFIPIPHTPVLIKFNAKPRVDFTYDTDNAGDDNRFITAKIPVVGDDAKGGGAVFNANAKGSQLRIDVRAPEVDGAPRFYYQNDFFASNGGEFGYRMQHIYGKIYNVTVGYTYGVFEDPDVWPDTVDYEGPNSAIFARVPLVHYQLSLSPEWLLTLGIEQPESLPSSLDGEPVKGVNHAPDGGFNVRWERSKVGHVQFATILRDIGARGVSEEVATGPATDDQSVLGWGFNLSGGFDLFGRDTLLAQLTYGHGIGRYSNDAGFFDTDAAFDESGDLVALPYLGVLIGYTHHWSDEWRSTGSYGYVEMDNEASQGPDAYHLTHYASLNLMWQIRERLTVGLEGLYGHKETQDGSPGDVGRAQVGVLYSIF